MQNRGQCPQCGLIFFVNNSGGFTRREPKLNEPLTSDDPIGGEFRRLARERKVDEALRFLEKNPELAKRQEIFYSCARKFTSPLLSKCIDLGAEVNQVDQIGLTALWNSIMATDIEKVRLLLDSGANPDLGWSISCLVDSNPEKRLPVRIENFPFDDGIRSGCQSNEPIKPWLQFVVTSAGILRRRAVCLDYRIWRQTPSSI